MRESVWPSPAATMNGVVPFSTAAAIGSRRISVRIVSTSPFIAASQNAVAPPYPPRDT